MRCGQHGRLAWVLGRMEYIDVAWIHGSASDPIRLVSELDSDRYEIRKLEFFSDGKVGHASRTRNSMGTELGVVPVPPLPEINQSPEFKGIAISAHVFEALWSANVPDET